MGRVWVFGGSEGIGEAVAEACSRRGDRVAIFARRTERLEATSRHLGILGLSADVEDPDSLADACERAAKALGEPDLVVNCAGRARPARFADKDLGDLQADLRVHVEGAWNVVKACLPLMPGGGTFVLTSSLAGLIPIFGYSDYAASKAGVIALAEVLRQELAPRKIDVRVLCPPDVDTPGFEIENRSKPRETRALSEGASLLTAEAVAGELLRGLDRRRFLIVPGRAARGLAAVVRLAPRLARRIVDRSLRAR